MIGIVGCGAEPDPAPRCGDGVVDRGEVCDDGNGVEGDGCNTDCLRSGTLQWCYRIPAPDDRSIYPTEMRAFEGGVLVAADFDPDHSGRDIGWLLALDSRGQPLWERTIDLPGVRYFSPSELVIDPERSAVLVLGSLYFEPDAQPGAWLGELELTTGALLRDQQYTEPDTPLIANALARLDEGLGLFMGGRTETDAWLRRLDADWDIVWDRRFNHDGGPDSVRAIHPRDDGRLAVIGTARKSEAWPGDEPVYPKFIFHRIYDLDGALEGSVSTISGDPLPSYNLGGSATWDGGVVLYTHAGILSYRLWRFTADGQALELWAEKRPGAIALAASDSGVFVSGTTGYDDPGPNQRWLARLGSDLRSFEWEYSGPPGGMDVIAAAVDEPAVYAVVIISRPLGGVDAEICKLSG